MPIICERDKYKTEPIVEMISLSKLDSSSISHGLISRFLGCC